MSVRNPKLVNTKFWDCVPQVGPCPIGCSQCFYNRPGAYYAPIDVPNIPDPDEVGNGIVRMNCGNDSNNQRELVIKTAIQYQRYFFNTSIPKFDFPGPVVLTANPKEEKEYFPPPKHIPINLMFVRLRVSGTNLALIDEAVAAWTATKVPVVLTFMAYYDKDVSVCTDDIDIPANLCYVWKTRHINEYWCATPLFMEAVLRRYRDNRLVSMCSSLECSYCRECLNCETYYIQTMKRLRGE